MNINYYDLREFYRRIARTDLVPPTPPSTADQMGLVRGLQLAWALHKGINDAGPMRWRYCSADQSDERKKRSRCAVLLILAAVLDPAAAQKAHPKRLWMGNRGALTGVKKAHPSEFWMRMGFGWGRMGILQAVTMTESMTMRTS